MAAMARWAGLLPPILACLLAGWCGNLLGGATAAGSSMAIGLLLACLAFTGPVPDPLRLGKLGRLWPLALAVCVALSGWLSPVRRAGLSAAVLLPAYLLLPASLARCWATPAARRFGARGFALATGAIALWALAAGAERSPAEVGAASGSAATDPATLSVLAHELQRLGLAPLGHHTALGLWIAALMPLALLACRESNGWRWVGLAAALAGVAASLAGRSLAGCAALACEGLAAAVWLRRHGLASATVTAMTAASAVPAGDGERPMRRDAPSRDWLTVAGTARRRRVATGLLVLVAAILALQAPRLWRLAALGDPSAQARWVYLRAGAAGWRERPWLGWGPGSTAWTIGWFLAPRPGLNPWGEAVGELHCLPVHLAYETGLLGLAAGAGLAMSFARRRAGERRGATDPLWLAAGGIGLGGAAVASLATAALAVAALPWAIATAAAASLAGGGRRCQEVEARITEREVQPRGGFRPAVWVYGLLALAALFGPQAARWHYDRAVAAGEAGRAVDATSALAAAVTLDPHLPLYRFRLALLQTGTVQRRPPPSTPRLRPSSPAAAPAPASPLPAPPPLPAELALGAAADARGVGLLWLGAGIMGQAQGELWSAAALEQACAEDPLGPYAPFFLMAVHPNARGAARLGARALLAEPRLAAATFWEGREALFRAVLDEVRRWPALDDGWKLALLRLAPPPAQRQGPSTYLGVTIDTGGVSQSASLHLFRRRPWTALWPLVEVRQAGLEDLRQLPAATVLATTDGAPFETGHCDWELTSAQ